MWDGKKPLTFTKYQFRRLRLAGSGVDAHRDITVPIVPICAHRGFSPIGDRILNKKRGSEKKLRFYGGINVLTDLKIATANLIIGRSCHKKDTS